MKLSLLCLPLFICFASAQEPSSSLSFQQVVSEVLQNSPESKIWQAETDRIQYMKWQAWSEAFPRINAYANAGRASMPIDLSSMGFGDLFPTDTTGNAPAFPSVIRTEADRYTYGVEFMQSLYSFGRLGQTRKVAKLEESSVKQNHDAQKQQIINQAFRVYGSVLLAKSQLEALQASEKRQKEAVAFLSRNFELGSGSKAEYLMAKSGLLGLEPRIIRAENQIQQLRIQLAGMMGRKGVFTEALEPIHSSPFDTTMPEFSGSAVSYAFSKRQDLVAMENQIQSLEAQAKYIDMLDRPSLGFQGKAGILAFKTDQLKEWNDNREWSVGVGLTWPLFDGRQNHNRSKQLYAESTILRARLNQVQTRVNIEVASALSELTASRKSVEAAEQAYLAAKDAWDVTAEDHKRGSGMYLQLLAAEENLRNSELFLLGAKWEYLFASANLNLVLGKELQ